MSGKLDYVTILCRERSVTSDSCPVRHPTSPCAFVHACSCEARRQTSESAVRAHVRELLERPSARVLVIGGGINGIAVFRELAFNGVDVALVERSDFASGASAASSRMIHGGVRYLENGELRLVRESVQERNALLRLARHRVRPARDHDPDLLGVLRHPVGAHAPGAAPLRPPGRARRAAHQDRPGAVRPVLARRSWRRPAAAAPIPRPPPLVARTPAAQPRRALHRHLSRRLASRAGAARDRRAARRAGCEPARSRRQLRHRGVRRRGAESGCATKRPARSSTSPPTSS